MARQPPRRCRHNHQASRPETGPGHGTPGRTGKEADVPIPRTREHSVRPVWFNNRLCSLSGPDAFTRSLQRLSASSQDDTTAGSKHHPAVAPELLLQKTRWNLEYAARISARPLGRQFLRQQRPCGVKTLPPRSPLNYRQGSARLAVFSPGSMDHRQRQAWPAARARLQTNSLHRQSTSIMNQVAQRTRTTNNS